MSTIHVPVLVSEVQEWLLTNPDGIYVDATIGAAGHSQMLLQHLSSDATLIGIDADQEILDEAEAVLRDFPQQIVLAAAPFSQVAAILQSQAIVQIDGLLMDLGLSSFQIDTPSKGFSYLREGPLDMRFSQGSGMSAADFLNTASLSEITEVLREYGEERNAKNLARVITERRPLVTTTDLREAVETITPDRFLIKTLARVFQAVRIQVNNELEQLQHALTTVIPFLRKGGRLAVISYHSLEDRIVKNLFQYEERDCICPPEIPVCVCEKEQRLKILTKNIILPSTEETNENPRARSAKLRVAERV